MCIGYTNIEGCGWGKTPYDLAAEGMIGRYKEVMEYLQTVMSEKSSGVTAGQGREGDMVPTEIKVMADKRSIDLYLKLLESGSEKKRDIRLVVVGKKGAGKTSLIRRLFGEDIIDVTSTNGIEIHTIKCKAMSDDGIWNKLDENYEETQARLFKGYMGKLQDKRTIQEQVESHIAIKDNTPVTSVDESKKSETASKLIIKPPEAAEPQSEPQVTPQQPSEQAARDFETMLTAKSKVDVHDKEEYATFLLWDFAGDEEFYHTHQTFLSQDAMYLVVTKLNEADDPNAQDLFRLWIDSIHCYSRLEEKNIISDDKTTMSGDLDPPVVIVGTWKDAVTSETDTVEEACRERLLVYTENLADDERGHVRSEYFISNKEDDHSVFQQIRRDMINLARGMRTWNKDYPLKFIQLEQRLQEKKKELPIITYQEMKNISSVIPKPLTEEELILFLEFHHDLRSLVYFKDLPENIILDTQWLSDAFKCIVTAKKFQASTKNQIRWNEFYHTGKLNYAVLEDIFKKETTILYDHKEYILNVMEKFDIIIRPNKSGADENPYFYVPCMIKAEPEHDIYEMFNVPKDICKRSTWLCFKFRFLPPHLMNHLIASLSRKYTVAEVVDSKKKKRQIALFKGTAVFELQQETTKLRKLLVMTCPNVIQIQIWEFGEDIKSGLYKYIADFVTEELNTIMHTRFKMSNVNFEKKWECGLTEPKCVTGSNIFMEEPIYQCDTCQIKHMFIDEWSDQQNKAPWLSQMSEKAQHVPVSNPSIDNTSQIVRVHVKAGKRDHSNVSEDQSSERSLREFTIEQINFTKMGIIVLNILADASYDLLKQDIPNLRPRNDCDITYLYQEHYNLKKHAPSNGWGGTWQKIQVTNIAVGDDIERIRLTRNELQHSRAAELGNTRFNELCNILSDLLKRFDQLNKPARLYTDHLNEILAKTISAQDVQSIENEIYGVDITVEIVNPVKAQP
ncbi:uncharacterized protein [Mytilus edulis]|uniref:uncharacterized protein n=1 Tax=Mytilus edulis TaxID=6550 RepID=UPI0039EEFBC1